MLVARFVVILVGALGIIGDHAVDDFPVASAFFVVAASYLGGASDCPKRKDVRLFFTSVALIIAAGFVIVPIVWRYAGDECEDAHALSDPIAARTKSRTSVGTPMHTVCIQYGNDLMLCPIR